MQEDNKYLKKIEDVTQTRIVKIVMWGLIGIIFVVISSISSCVMYSNSVEEDQIKARTEQIKEEAKIKEAQSAAIIKLIENGTDPIVARCAIVGYPIITNGIISYNPCARTKGPTEIHGEPIR